MLVVQFGSPPQPSLEALRGAVAAPKPYDIQGIMQAWEEALRERVPEGTER